MPSDDQNPKEPYDYIGYKPSIPSLLRHTDRPFLFRSKGMQAFHPFLTHLDQLDVFVRFPASSSTTSFHQSLKQLIPSIQIRKQIFTCFFHRLFKRNLHHLFAHASIFCRKGKFINEFCDFHIKKHDRDPRF